MVNIFTFFFIYFLWFIFCLFWPAQQCGGHCGLEAARRSFHPCARGLAHSPSICVGSHQVLRIPPTAQKHITFSRRRIRDSKLVRMAVCFSTWPSIKQKNGYGKWKDGHTFSNKNSLIVDAHLSLSKCRERRFKFSSAVFCDCAWKEYNAAISLYKDTQRFLHNCC